jgi:hypothetical protein
MSNTIAVSSSAAASVGGGCGREEGRSGNVEGRTGGGEAERAARGSEGGAGVRVGSREGGSVLPSNICWIRSSTSSNPSLLLAVPAPSATDSISSKTCSSYHDKIRVRWGRGSFKMKHLYCENRFFHSTPLEDLPSEKLRSGPQTKVSCVTCNVSKRASQ